MTSKTIKTISIVTILVVIEVLAGLWAKYYSGIDWDRLDEVVTYKAPSSSSPTASGSGTRVPTRVNMPYVDCTLSGVTYRMPIEACKHAQETYGQMAP